MNQEDFEQLEAKINQLLDRHAKVVKEKDLMEKRLRQREDEFHQLKGQIRNYERERGEIRSRLEKILGHLENLDLP
jgi:chromosome segregation ATPase